MASHNTLQTTGSWIPLRDRLDILVWNLDKRDTATPTLPFFRKVSLLLHSGYLVSSPAIVSALQIAGTCISADTPISFPDASRRDQNER